MKKLLLPLLVVFAFMAGLPMLSSAQNSATWNTTNATGAWYTTGNWTSSTTTDTFPGAKAATTSNTDIAIVAGTVGANMGINMNTSSLSLGAIYFNSSFSTATNIGNSSSAKAGTLALYGPTVNGNGNVILENDGSATATLAATYTGTMGIVLGNTTGNVIYINGSGGINISAIISTGTGAGGLVLRGTGTGAITLSGANTFTGSFSNFATSTVPLNINNNSALGTGTFYAGSAPIDNTSGSDVTITNPLNLQSSTFTYTGSANNLTQTTGAIVTPYSSVTFNIKGKTLTLGGVYSGSGNSLIKTGVGNLVLSGANTYDAGTTVTAGTLTCGAANTIPSSGTFTLNGGTFSSGASVGYTQSTGTLALTDNSTIALGTGSHSLSFAASNGVSWTSGKTITITGWTGTAGSSGTAGKIFVGTDATGLTSTQLGQITFSGYSGPTTILSTGEVVPAPTPTLSAITLGSGMSNNLGTASTPGVSFTVSGTNLTGTITVTPNAGWEISTTSSTTGFQGSGTAITGLSSGATVYIRNAASLAGGTYNSTTCAVVSSTGASSVNVTTSASGNTVTAPASLNAVTLVSALSNTYGSASSPVSFTASGTSLTNTITVTPNAGWEISSPSNSSFQGSGVAITGLSSGTTVYIRNTTALPAGSYNSTTCAVISSTGAANVNISTSASGNTVSAYALTISGISVANKNYDGTTSGIITGTATLSATVNSDVITLGGTPTATFASSAVGTGVSVTIAGYTISGTNAGNYSLTQPSGLTANINALSTNFNDGNLSVLKVAGPSAILTYSGTTTNGSTSVTALTITSTTSTVTLAHLVAGMVVTGPGIAPGTYLTTAASGSSPTGTCTLSQAAGSGAGTGTLTFTGATYNISCSGLSSSVATCTVASATGLYVGMAVQGQGVSTTISSISGTTVTLATKPVASVSATEVLTFYTSGDVTSAMSPIVVDEYGTWASQNAADFSYGLPYHLTGTFPSTATTNDIIISGTTTGMAMVKRSQNGRYLSFAGYNNVANAALAAGAVAEGIRTVGGTGTLAPLYGSTNYNGINSAGTTSSNDWFRFAGVDMFNTITDDGTNYWLETYGGVSVIQGSATTQTPLPNTTNIATGNLCTTTGNSTSNRGIFIQNGQLYLTTAATNQGIYAVGTGTPTVAGQTATRLFTPTNTDVYSFALSPDGLTLYYASANSSTVGGIYRSVNTGTVASPVWSAGTQVFAMVGCRDVAVDWSGYTYSASAANGAKVYFITNVNLYSFSDNGTTAVTPTILTTVSGSYLFRGLSFSPIKQTVSLGAQTPYAGNITANTSSNALFQFNLSADEGSSTIKSLTVTNSGTASIGNSTGDFNTFKLYLSDGSGNPTGSVLATGVVSGSNIVFSGISLSNYISQGSSLNFVVVGNVSATAINGHTFIPAIVSNQSLNSVNYTTNLVNAGGSWVTIGSTAPTGNTLTVTGGVTPTISKSGTLAALSTTYGTASSTTSFTVSGSNMAAGITVTPPAGFEVSQTVGGASGYAGSGTAITVGSAGTIATTTIYVRLAATATVGSSPYTGNVVLTSYGATTVNEATVSSTVSTATLTITGISIADKTYDGNTLATITGTASYSGLQNGESFAVTGTPSAVFTSAAQGTGISVTVTGYTAPSTNYTVTQPTGLTASITAPTAFVYANSATSVTSSAFSTTYGTASTAQTFAITGNGLTASVIATAPTGFEVSSDGATYGSTATFSQSGGNASGTLYVRLKATSAVTGSYNSLFVAINSTGAGQVPIYTASSGNTVSPATLTITGISISNKSYDGTTTATITGTAAYSGLKNGESYSVTGTPTAVFTSSAIGFNVAVTVTGYTAPSSNYTITQPTGLTANITTFTDGNLSVLRVTSSSALSTSSAAAMVVDEYLPSTASQSTTNYTYSLPSHGTSGTQTSGDIVTVGGTTTLGLISTSQNGRYLAIPGYYSYVGAGTSSLYNETVRLLSGNATYNNGITDPASVAGSAWVGGYTYFNSGTTDDGSNYWISGSNSASLLYVAGGSTTATTMASAVPVYNLRTINGQLYFANGVSTFGIDQVGNTTLGSTPPIAATTPTRLFTSAAAAYDFSVSPDLLTVYFTTTSGVYRTTYSGTATLSTATYSGGTWATPVLVYSGSGYTGIAVNWTKYAFSTASANGAVVYSCNPTTLITFNDNGTTPITTPTTLRTISGNNAFRGLTFSPIKQTLSLGANTPSAGNINANTTAKVLFQFNLAATEGSSTIQGVTINNGGTAVLSTEISNFKLYLSDGSGNATGSVLATGTVSGSNITFSGISLSTYIAQGTSQNFVLLGDVASGATGGHTFIPSIVSNQTLNSVNYTTNLVNAGGSWVTIGATAPTGNTLTLVGVPAAPVFTATAGDSKITVDFTPPSNGGSPITSYQYTINGGVSYVTASVSSNSFTISGLTNGTTYSVAIRAVNAIGNGTLSGYKSAIPSAIALSISDLTSGAYDFGSVCYSATYSQFTFTLSNTGTQSATIGSISVGGTDAGQYAISGFTNGTVVAGNSSTTFTVTYTPSSTSTQNATITVNCSTSGGNSPSAALTGYGANAVTASFATSAASSIVNTTATLNGTVTTLGVCPTTIEQGFVYSKTSVNSSPIVGGSGVTKVSVSGLSTGAYSQSLTGLTPATGYTFNTYLYDGTTYTYGTAATFSTLAAATHLVFSSSTPTYATSATSLTSFTVNATRPDGSTDASYTGTVTLTATSGDDAGSLAGTTTATLVNGVATFSAVNFTGTGGSNTITATSGSLTGVSGNIAIYCTPALTGSLGGDYLTTLYTTGGSTNITLEGLTSANAAKYAYFTAASANPGFPTLGAATVGKLTILSGSSFTINMTNGNSFALDAGVYIDYDNSGTFSSSQLIAEMNAAASSTHAYTVNVPSTFSAGTYRMRIVYTENTYPYFTTDGTPATAKSTISGCSTGSNISSYGFTQDFDVTLLANDFYWTPANGSSVTWNTSTSNWQDASNNPVTWPATTTAAATANFNSTTYTNVTIPGTLAVIPSTINIGSNYTFNVTGSSSFSSLVSLGSNTLTTAPTGGNTLTLSSAISGVGGSLTQNGAGTTVLSATNTYTGNTTVSAGTLTVNGAIKSTTTTTVSSGATLSGTGTVGTAILNSGSTVSPGGSGTVGTLTTGAITIAGGTIYTADIASSGTTATVDLISSGVVTNNATSVSKFTINLSGTLSPSFANNSSYTWNLFSFASASNAFSAANTTLNTSGIVTTNLGGGTFSLAFTSTNVQLVFTPVPLAPASAMAYDDNGQASIVFTAPASNSSLPVLDYTITAIPASGSNIVKTGIASSPYIFTGLTNGTTYKFAVAARNSVGTGANDTSNAVTPSSTTTWNGTSWSATAPDASQSGVIAANLNNSNSVGTFSACASLTINSGVTFTLNSTVTIYGAFVNNGIVTGSGTIILAGSANQTISGNGIVSNITINNSNGVTVASGSNSLGVTGVLTLQSGQLTTNGSLTLKSTSISSTGTLAAIDGTTNTGSISGNVTVERFIPKGFRGYRDLAPEVYGAGTIFKNWQENGASPAGYGIFVTGPTAYPGSANAGISGGGFDKSGVVSGNTQDYTYVNGTWTAFVNTNSTNLNPFTGYRLLIRGDRTANLYTTPVVNTQSGLAMFNATALRATGQLITGTVTYSKTNVISTVATDNTVTLDNNVGGFSLVANPYVCPVLWGTGSGSQSSTTSVYGASANINGSYWYLDPTYSATGRYLAFNALTGSSVVRTTTNGDTTYNSTASLGYIQPGQAVFVQTFAASPTVVFKETAKAASSTKGAIFGTASLSKIYVSLMKQTSGATTYDRVDGAAVAFRSDFGNTAYGPQDALKLAGATDNLSISDKGKNLSIDGRLPATASDAVSLAISKPSGKSYQLQVDATAYASNGFVPVLYDAYKNTTTKLGTGVSNVDFTIDTAVSSSYSNRFTILFTPSALPVNSIVASASLNNKVATITWNTVGEKGVARYEVEKSTDAKTFATIGQSTAKNTATASYATTDNSVTATTYYRIKAVSTTGAVSYSNIAKLSIINYQLSISLYPNPLKGKTLNVALDNVVAGKYTVSIYNALGQKVNEQTISHTGGSATHALVIGNTLAAGVYNVTISEAGSKQLVHQSTLSVQP